MCHTPQKNIDVMTYPCIDLDYSLWVKGATGSYYIDAVLQDCSFSSALTMDMYRHVPI